MPLRGLISIAEIIQECVDKEMYSVEYIHKEIVKLYLLFERNEIEEADLLQKETILLGRLNAIQEQQDTMEELADAKEPWQIESWINDGMED